MNDSLNTLQLVHALTHNEITRPYFDGVYASDTLNDIQQRPRLIICNTDPMDKPGKHWLLFNFTEDSGVEMFDSLGRDIHAYSKNILKCLSKFATLSKILIDRVQPINTSLCGHYCLYYAYCRCNGQSMTSIAAEMPPAEFIKCYVPILFDIPDIKSNCQCCIDC